ncbi:unnamed protein product [Pedinophyceae sp. YPF-701]|nr:unnamed protein product [Pedinophyceae sp. YPF-701]
MALVVPARALPARAPESETKMAGAGPPMGQWTTGLCGCFEDCPTMCYTLEVPCCVFGETANIVLEDKGACGCACYYCLCSYIGLCCIAHIPVRQRLKEKFGIPASGGDCFVTTFCCLCAICQEARELKNRGITRPGMIGARATTTAPQQQQAQGGGGGPVYAV